MHPVHLYKRQGRPRGRPRGRPPGGLVKPVANPEVAMKPSHLHSGCHR